MASSNGRSQLRCANYHVAWICPVADIELLPAQLMLDEEHTPPPYNTHYDENTYICGTINGHAVVVATCPQGETGNVNAGRLTGSMFKTFPNIRMVVLVGIGGGIPRTPASQHPLKDIHLGDVVVGWPGDGKPACVYHDRGRAKAGGEFEMVGTMQNPDWRLTNALSMLALDYKLRRTKFHEQLARLRDFDEFAHPGLEHDRLFKAGHPHASGYGSDCTACDPNELVPRPLRTEDDKNKFVFHQGRIATGNAVIQDGELRDQIGARCGGALCVEMEAAGVDANRRCLVIRGISDYADSHKSDVWRPYAAGKAAAFARELLCRIPPGTVKEMEGVDAGLREALWMVPFLRPPSFAGRETQLAQLDAHVSSEGGRRLAIYGLGGCGKTALALEAAYRTRERQPARAVLWVSTVSRESFEQAYREMGERLSIPGITDDNADVKRLVRAWLSSEKVGQWLMVVDNADDDSVLFGALGETSRTDRLIDWLPHSRKGSIVFTTRTRTAAIRLAESNVVPLGELTKAEAEEVLKTRLLQEHQHQLQDGKVIDEFLGMLTCLALAIIQAVAFINTNDVALSDYISDYRSSEKDAMTLLGEEFEDQGRHRDTKNPVATTCLRWLSGDTGPRPSNYPSMPQPLCLPPGTMQLRCFRQLS
ncbi:purine and uridine phosphorylase [Byssothecium circinans]|uniref:Purine and uridine phosphorylase n=1 Tax=Byssothecium circinans TaxID=147558 RepID=A0A6A5TEA7_9PLEO|nr:purine and uridine phosphorylase [Byssothecium circinans]